MAKSAKAVIAAIEKTNRLYAGRARNNNTLSQVAPAIHGVTTAVRQLWRMHNEGSLKNISNVELKRHFDTVYRGVAESGMSHLNADLIPVWSEMGLIGKLISYSQGKL